MNRMLKTLIVAAIASLPLTGANAQFRINIGDESPLRKLQIAEVATTNLYVDSVDEKKLVEDAIRGMLEKLDPHSQYSTPETDERAPTRQLRRHRRTVQHD